MSEGQQLDAERARLHRRLEELAGPGPIAQLEAALTHPSFANEMGVADNQRLEFLGDAILGFCVSEMLSRTHPDADEGELTRMRSALVNAGSLAAWARRVSLGACIALGKGARLGAERDQTNVLADATEALIAAVYEARGLEGACALVRDVCGPALQDAEALSTLDPKSTLQERVQSRGLGTPKYRVVEMRGPAHAQVFVVEVSVGEKGEAMARGEGRSKRTAERAAANAALDKLARGE